MSYEDFHTGSISYASELTSGKRFNKETFKGKTWLRTKSNVSNANCMHAHGGAGEEV
ncbi:MAG: hypothetical protein K2F55_02750 [Erysipelotrichaceae bacterium]|nr:hypothetical protein [Erysipelotrichaceae bacterium]